MHPFRMLIMVLMAAPFLRASVFVTAPDGDDANPGTFDRPFGTLARAVDAALPGDTVYVRGGQWILPDAIRISASRSGVADRTVRFSAFPGERPLLDFSSSPLGKKGILLQASHWRITGLDIRGAGDNGMEIDGGSHNIVEHCAFFENRDTGLQLSRGASDNRIIRCDSYRNADPPDYGDADGFAPKLAVGTGNVFTACRAWENCDDGWDGYLRGADGVTTVLDSCWTWRNGFLADGTDPGSQANGNGFKTGGGDDGNASRLMHHVILNRCIAFDNKAKGFDQNHNRGTMTLRHCSGYRNRAANYSFFEAVNEGQSVSVRNGLSFAGSVSLAGTVEQGPASWQSPFHVGEEDFVTLDTAGVSGPRGEDGALPVLDFLRLAEGSDLVDGGEDIGEIFWGTGPDLGAFESPFASAAPDMRIRPEGFALVPAFPNPFNCRTVLRYRNPVPCRVTLTVLDVTGKRVETLVDAILGPGTHETVWDAGVRASGVYLIRFSVNGFSETRKILLQK